MMSADPQTQAAERRTRDNKQCGHGDHIQVDVEAEAAKAAKDSIVIDLSSDSESDTELPSSKASSSRVKVEDTAPSTSSSDDDIQLVSSSMPPASSRAASIVAKRKPTSPLPKERSVKRPTPVPKPSVWACSACTFENASASLQCQVCEALRTNVAQLLDKPARSNAVQASRPIAGPTWLCHICVSPRVFRYMQYLILRLQATETSHDFWSCRLCGAIKLSS